MAFKEIAIDELSFNPFDKIAKQWMLITAGNKEGSNTMTASWGGLGIMWEEGSHCIHSSSEIYKRIRGQGRDFHPFFPSGNRAESFEYLRKHLRQRSEE